MALIDIFQNTLDGLTAGASYALLGVGFTLIFGVLRRANLSYGPAIMLGAYAATWVSLHTGAGLLVLFLVAVLATVLAGSYVERLCFAPHRRGPAAAAMVASFAIWMQLEELATLLLPRHLYAFPALYEGGALHFGPFSLRVESLLMLLAALAVCFVGWKALYATRFGVAVRAVIDDPRAAELSGISVGAISLRVFALASAIGGLTGFLIVASHEQVTPMLGMWSTLKGMLAMMLGGLGSLPGAVVGGLALGLIEAHSQWYLGPQFRDFIAYFLLFALLAARPPWMNTRSAY
ncbi:MAG TPA: branched-chain amino acid ABC transporter permease [Burkholderiales bacterium]|nr:branched-chain amino acid ABC transporter permease [Burkholderiales bacterium]